MCAGEPATASETWMPRTSFGIAMWLEATALTLGGATIGGVELFRSTGTRFWLPPPSDVQAPAATQTTTAIEASAAARRRRCVRRIVER